VAWVIPRVIAGDSIERNSMRLDIEPIMAGGNQGTFGFITSSMAMGNVGTDPFKLTFVDNGFGGLVRSTSSTGFEYNNVGSIFYDRGVVLQTDPTMFWAGRFSALVGRTPWVMEFTSSNSAFVRESEYTIPKNAARHGVNSSGSLDLFTGIDVMDSNGNILERIAIAQPVARLSGSAVTVRTITIF